MNDTVLDYSRYFWQGEKVRLRPIRIEDAEQSFISSLDSPSRQLLQLGIELPTSIELQILLKYGFWERRYQKCNSACVDTNEGSIKLHEKLGFLEEGRRRRQLFFNGKYHDEILFGLTREEFDAQVER